MTASRWNFRVWSPTVNQWAEQPSMEYTSYEICHENDLEWCNNDAILMQSTGLTDRNGKEIFEGDIVSLFNEIAAIEWNDPFAGFCFSKDLTCYAVGVSGVRNLEVIGNIYEHPHLLEKNEA